MAPGSVEGYRGTPRRRRSAWSALQVSGCHGWPPLGCRGQRQGSHACRGNLDDGSPYPRQHPDAAPTRQARCIGGTESTGMREIVFLVTAEQPGRIEAKAPERGLVVEAPTLEELHHEARDALIRQVGPSHATYRIRIRRGGHAAVPASGDQPSQRHPLPKARSFLTVKPSGEGFGAESLTPAPQPVGSPRA
jgi:hypothetical protein